MTTDVYIPKPDEIVRLGVWVGVVLDVFKSETTGKHIAQIKFAKNVYKQQPRGTSRVGGSLRSHATLPGFE